jgi:hypothetical protein
MAIDPKININENQVVFRRDVGHNHDGLTSSLIDYKKYSIFDFVPFPVAAPNSPRRVFEDNNIRSFKSFIVSAVEERVLNPQGIRVQANAITAREIVAGTISANELSSNVVLVNNIIRSGSFNGTFHANGVINDSGTAGWAISHSGSSVFNNSIIRGSIQAGTIDIVATVGSGSFRVDNNGNMWLGATTFTSAPFRVSSGGVLRSRLVSGSNIYTTTLTNASYRNEWYDGSLNAFAVFEIGSTALYHSGYFVGTGNLADTSVRERVVYQTNAIYMDARRALGTSYSNGIVYLATERIDTTGEQRTRGRLQLESRDDTSAALNYVNITDGTVDANVVFFAGGFPRGGNNTGAIGGPPPTFSAWNLVASYNFFTASDGRFKDNQKELPLGLSFINKLQPIEYTNLAPRVIKARLAKEGEEQEEDVFEWDIGSRLRAGFTAQNVQEALISEDVGDYNLWSMADKNDPDSFQMLDYTQLIAPVVQAIKEIDKKIQDLASKMDSIEVRLQALEDV